MQTQIDPKLLPIIWIETGRRMPRYLRNLSKLTKRMHPEHVQFMIQEKESHLESVESVSLRSIPASDFTRSFEQLEFRSFNDDEVFWKSTTARFFYLYDFMMQRNLEHVLHLESDCLILELEHIRKIALSDESRLAYPRYSSHLATAAVFLVNSQNALRNFLEFALNRLEKSWVNDMQILAEYSQVADVTNLNTNLSGLNSRVFDAGVLGVYYLGVDARNRRLPFSRRGTISGVSSSSAEFDRVKEDLTQIDSWQCLERENKLELSYDLEGKRYQVQNLHVHSKKIPRSNHRVYSQLKTGFQPKRSLSWSVGRIDFIVLYERLCTSILRRVLRKKNVRINFR